MKVFFSLRIKHFASQFGFRTSFSFLFRGLGRPPCRVPTGSILVFFSFFFSLPPPASRDFSVISQPTLMKFGMLIVLDEANRLNIFFKSIGPGVGTGRGPKVLLCFIIGKTLYTVRRDKNFT